MITAASTGDLFWTDTGAGRPVLLLHGGFLDHRMWDDQAPGLAAAGHRVIAPDARGHGRSANAAGPFRHVDDAAALIRRLDAGPVVCVGVSMGASTAVDLVLEYPELVEAVVVSGAGTSEPSFTDPWTRDVLGRWQAAMAGGDLPGSVEAFLAFAAGPRRTLGDVAPEVVARLRAMAGATMAKHTAGEPGVLVPVADTWRRAARIEQPVLALCGALDAADHLAMADRLVSTVRRGRGIRIDGAAHYPNMERPERFTAHLAEFLAGL
ncbi:alpha/beta fold hydrolase [Actinocorallia aurea]